jgi:hypothetical protein
MYTVLMVAALAVGSGDGRDGATDARTAPERLDLPLRKGMQLPQVAEAMKATGRFDYISNELYGGFWAREGDSTGKWQYVTVYYHDGRLVYWWVQIIQCKR